MCPCAHECTVVAPLAVSTALPPFVTMVPLCAYFTLSKYRDPSAEEADPNWVRTAMGVAVKSESIITADPIPTAISTPTGALSM